MNSKSFSFTRRHMFRGLGGMIALPWLEILQRSARSADAPLEPARLACFYIPGAINRHGWFPVDEGADYTLAPSHRPLTRHRERFSVLTNLSHIRGRISGHEHPYNWLTGADIKSTPGAITNTISLDQVAARYLGRTYVPALVLSYADGVGALTLSRNANGADLPATANARQVFARLFPPADPEQIKQAQARLALDRSILDAASAEVRSFRSRLGSADSRRLDLYLESVRELETRLVERDSLLAQGRPQFDARGIRVEPESGNRMQDHLEIMMDLIALAFQTDMTRVVTQCLGGEGRPNYDDYRDWAAKAGSPLRGVHEYHHLASVGHGPDDPFAKVLGYRDEMFCACLARLMDKLQAVSTPDGTLLDRSVLLLGGSQTRTHSGSSFPMLLAGGGNLGFRHGRHYKWQPDAKPASDLYLTILQQLGCPVTKFSESQGPLREVLA